MKKILLAFAITIGSYIFQDDPNLDPVFDKLTFWGRFNYYLDKIKKEGLPKV